MKTDGGFIRQYRRLWDNPVFKNKQEAGVFSWMLSAAQWRPCRIRTDYGPVALDVGELLISERQLAADFGLHRNAVRRLIHRMVDEGVIELKRDQPTSPIGTRVRIVKYVEYQVVAGGRDQPQNQPQDQLGTSSGPARDQLGTSLYIEKEGNEGNEGEANRTLSESETSESLPRARARETQPPPPQPAPRPPVTAVEAPADIPIPEPRPPAAAPEGEEEIFDGPVVRLAPPPQAPPPQAPPPQAPPPEAPEPTPRPTGAALREIKKRQLLQKLMRFVNATMTGPEQQAATLGLMGCDDSRSAQEWFDDIDRRRKRQGWDDMREWRQMAGLAAANVQVPAMAMVSRGGSHALPS